MPVVRPYEGSRAPWPVVEECYGHPRGQRRRDGRAGCEQCYGTHEHRWVEWLDYREQDGRFTVSGPGSPVRCETCGARKCDMPVCSLKRHHRSVHADPAPTGDADLLESWLTS